MRLRVRREAPLLELEDPPRALTLDLTGAEGGEGSLVSFDQIFHLWPLLMRECDSLRVRSGAPGEGDLLWEIFDYFGDLGDDQRAALELEIGLDMPEEAFDWLILKTHYVRRLTLKPVGDLSAERLERFLRHGRLCALDVSSLSPEARGCAVTKTAGFRPGFVTGDLPSI